MRSLALFLLMNSGLPGADVVTDFLTFLALRPVHPYWAFFSLFWMFVSFLVHLGFFVFRFIKAKQNGVQITIASEASNGNLFKQVIVYIPPMLPIWNIVLAVKLLRLGYASSSPDPRNAREIEAILTEAGLGSINESFFEAGPQAVTQLIILLSSGTMSTVQMVTIPFSILTSEMEN